MNTQTHLLLATVLLAKNGKKHRARNLIIFLGALTPDVLIFAMAGIASLNNVPAKTVWSEWYFTSPWQTWIDASNSIPLYLASLVLGLIFIKKKSARKYLTLFVIAALIHILFDLPVHADDAHAHFWPLSQWRFESEFSYWDPKHHGILISCLEAAFGLLLIHILWKRFKNKPDKSVIRPLLIFFASLYILVPIMYLVILPI